MLKKLYFGIKHSDCILQVMRLVLTNQRALFELISDPTCTTYIFCQRVLMSWCHSAFVYVCILVGFSAYLCIVNFVLVCVFFVLRVGLYLCVLCCLDRYLVVRDRERNNEA